MVLRPEMKELNQIEMSLINYVSQTISFQLILCVSDRIK